jgi:hypothetical protein
MTFLEARKILNPHARRTSITARTCHGRFDCLDAVAAESQTRGVK